jgi:hypothetical protein
MEEKRPSLMMVAVVLLLALPMLYVGSYLALVRPEEPLFGPPVATYRWGGAGSRLLFAPANAVDRHIRPQRWTRQHSEPSLIPSL